MKGFVDCMLKAGYPGPWGIEVLSQDFRSFPLDVLAMRAFNEFWCERVPNLRPTAGYPVDARRFRHEIREVQQSLDMPDDWLWRTR